MTAPSKRNHPNRVPFEGVLTRLDQPSDKAPDGSRSHRVILTSAAAEAALGSLIGMAVGFKSSWDGHNARQKCGIISDAAIVGNELRVQGYLFCHDFPEVAEMMSSGTPMGMSYEMINAHVRDMRAAVWELTRVTFTGAAILLRSKAAYRSSRITIEAVSEVFNGRLSMIGQVRPVAKVRKSRAGRPPKRG